MARKAEELYKAALALSAEEREELKRLLSMQPDSGYASPEIEKAWMDEIERRRTKSVSMPHTPRLPPSRIGRRRLLCPFPV